MNDDDKSSGAPPLAVIPSTQVTLRETPAGLRESQDLTTDEGQELSIEALWEEVKALREREAARRVGDPKLQRVLAHLAGVDPEGATVEVLTALLDKAAAEDGGAGKPAAPGVAGLLARLRGRKAGQSTRDTLLALVVVKILSEWTGVDLTALLM